MRLRPALRLQSDKPAKTGPDPDTDSPQLRVDHELLWTKRLDSGVLFSPIGPPRRGDGYLIFTDDEGDRHRYGNDAITSSYTAWRQPKALAKAIAGLTKDQKRRYLYPPYTAGSIMI